MGFETEFNSVCKFKSEQELYELLEYGKGKMVKSGFRVFPTGQKVIAYAPDNQAIAIVKISASIAEINFQGEEVTQVEMQLVRKLTEEEARVQTALAYEMFFGDRS
ncbi:intracellular growth attenuator family protein [Paenibacillus tarimensis]|uniref:intracellular growth attenuator family protein n=1 Tax=Paenibacillus tarimensis TaxID=416012 RepID=UPI001F348897|nr:intracellular growth attenuator family protein [Paenibacillus tarimensis]MCF2945994.1 intracellular growth attenuator family protein [Paenibacillus tarimensis]